MMQSNHVAGEFDAGCGLRLQRARGAAGLSLEEISTRLKVPVRVLRALEAGDWSLLDAPVFIRGQLRSYARLLNVDIESDLLAIPGTDVKPATLVSHTHTPRYRRVAEQLTRRAIYIVLTATLAVPVWMATRPHFAGDGLSVQSLDMSATDAAAMAPESTDPATPRRTPVVASMASLPSASTPAATSGLTLTLNGDSWVQVFALDGHALEQGLMAAGQSRTYAQGEVSRVVLGNSSAVEVRRAGQAVDLAPFSRANVARFTLSSDGSLVPIRD